MTEPIFTITDPPPAPISLEQHLKKVYDELQQYSEHPKPEFDGIYQQLSDKMRRQEWFPSWFQAEEMPRSGEPVMDTEPRILMALAGLIDAREALRLGKTDAAWSQLCEVYRWIGYFDRLSDFEIFARNKQDLIKAKQEAAASKAITLKVKAIELFGRKRPQDGWPSFEGSLEAIKAQLEQHTDRHAPDANPPDVAKRVNHYKRTDAVFVAAFNSHASEKGKLPDPNQEPRPVPRTFSRLPFHNGDLGCGVQVAD